VVDTGPHRERADDVVYYQRKNGFWFESAGVMIAADHVPFLDE
jgi:hypothetical protein